MGSAGEDFDQGDVLTAARLAQKTVKTDTGANINAETKYDGMIVFPTSSNGSLTADIPAVYDSDDTTFRDFTLTGATQTLTNKTVNATDNTITDTSTAAEDLFRSNGTKFVRFAKGSNYNFLRVNGSGALEYDEILGNELGRTTLGGAGTTITVSSLTAKKQLVILIRLRDSGGSSANIDIRFNNDSGTNYSYRYSANGGAESTGTNATGARVFAGAGERLIVLYVQNAAAGAMKVGYASGVGNTNTDDGTAPDRYEAAIKWNDTSAQITRVDVITSANVGTGSECVVYGTD